MSTVIALEFAIVSKNPLNSDFCANAVAGYPEELYLASVSNDGALRLSEPASAAEMTLVRSRKITATADLERQFGAALSAVSEPLWFTEVIARGWSHQHTLALVNAIAAAMSGAAFRR